MNKLITPLVLCLLISLQSFQLGNEPLEKVHHLIENDTEPSIDSTSSSMKLTVANVKKMLIKEGVLHPDIVLRQAIVESGWFKCENCSLDKNNIFGFYYKKKYLSYDTWIDCIKYYKRWQGRHYKGGDYYAFLKKVGFATNPNYARDLKQIKL